MPYKYPLVDSYPQFRTEQVSSSPIVESTGTFHTTKYPGVANIQWTATASVLTFGMPEGYEVEGHRAAWIALAKLSDPQFQIHDRWKQYHNGSPSRLDPDIQNDMRESFKSHDACIVIKEDGVLLGSRV